MRVMPDVLRTMPSKAIELTSYDVYKRFLSHTDLRTGKKRPPGPVASFMAGALAGEIREMFDVRVEDEDQSQGIESRGDDT